MQANLSFCWAHTSEGTFSHIVAEIFTEFLDTEVSVSEKQNRLLLLAYKMETVYIVTCSEPAQFVTNFSTTSLL